jgi:hypothetical protein
MRASPTSSFPPRMVWVQKSAKLLLDSRLGLAGCQTALIVNKLLASCASFSYYSLKVGQSNTEWECRYEHLPYQTYSPGAILDSSAAEQSGLALSWHTGKAWEQHLAQQEASIGVILSQQRLKLHYALVLIREDCFGCSPFASWDASDLPYYVGTDLAGDREDAQE